jgi:hypothetical protein
MVNTLQACACLAHRERTGGRSASPLDPKPQISLSRPHDQNCRETSNTLHLKKTEHHRFQTKDTGHIHQEMTTPWTESDHNRIMMSPTTKLHIQLDPSPTRERKHI